MWTNWNPCTLLMVHLLWKTVWLFLKWSNIELPYDSALPLLVHIQERWKYVHAKPCPWKFTEAVFIIAKKSKQRKCPSTDKWVDKMWYLHTMKFYFTIKRKEVWTYVSTWMNLKHMRSYKRPHMIWFHAYGMSRTGKSRLSISGCLGVGEEEYRGDS